MTWEEATLYTFNQTVNLQRIQNCEDLFNRMNNVQPSIEYIELKKLYTNQICNNEQKLQTFVRWGGGAVKNHQFTSNCSQMSNYPHPSLLPESDLLMDLLS